MRRIKFDGTSMSKPGLSVYMSSRYILTWLVIDIHKTDVDIETTLSSFLLTIISHNSPSKSTIA